MKRCKEAVCVGICVTLVSVIGVVAYRCGEDRVVQSQRRQLITERQSSATAADHDRWASTLDALCDAREYATAFEAIAAVDPIDKSLASALRKQCMQRSVDWFNELLESEKYREAHELATDLFRVLGRQEVVLSMLKKAELGLEMDQNNLDSPFRPIRHEQSV